MAGGWREVFDRSRLLPPPSQTVRLAADSHLSQSHGFQLSLSRVTAAPPPQVTAWLPGTLFDRNHQHFFGKTWKSSPQRMKNNKISFSEVLYFHTSLRLPSTVVVVELVSLSPKPDGSQQALGRGFAVLELFINSPDAQAADGDRRLSLHHGSPRSLLHPLLKDTIDCKNAMFSKDHTYTHPLA
uniref:Nephronophthisis 4 n=1 Tax=Echeneis naucrates TaxID=173247 RepID=A0A665SVR9_ECHNA